MDDTKFAELIKTVVIDNGIDLYRTHFRDMARAEARDSYSQKALQLFDALPKELQEPFFQVLRQVAVDTTSHLLGILDGVSTLDSSNPVQFEVRVLPQNSVVSGNLQDEFLEAIEDDA